MKSRRKAWRRGRRAETACAWMLRLKGYRVLERGFRAPVGEIDIVARRGGILAIIEVKRRDSRDAAADSVTPQQRARIRRAAEAYLSQNPGFAGLGIRFDAMLLAPYRWSQHVVDAWRS